MPEIRKTELSETSQEIVLYTESAPEIAFAHEPVFQETGLKLRPKASCRTKSAFSLCSTALARRGDPASEAWKGHTPSPASSSLPRAGGHSRGRQVSSAWGTSQSNTHGQSLPKPHKQQWAV